MFSRLGSLARIRIIICERLHYTHFSISRAAVVSQRRPFVAQTCTQPVVREPVRIKASHKKNLSYVTHSSFYFPLHEPKRLLSLVPEAPGSIAKNNCFVFYSCSHRVRQKSKFSHVSENDLQPRSFLTDATAF